MIGDALLLQYVLRKRSARSVTELTVRQARQMLAAWAAEQDAAGSRRGEAVQAAIDAGLGKSDVHRLAGMARTTIGRIAGALPAMGPGPAVTGIWAGCVAIARPYALGIPGRARHDARVSGTAGLRFRHGWPAFPDDRGHSRTVPSREEKHC